SIPSSWKPSWRKPKRNWRNSRRNWPKPRPISRNCSADCWGTRPSPCCRNRSASSIRSGAICWNRPNGRGPLSQQVLEEEEEQPPERGPRPHRHPLRVSLETETVTLEPETTTCPHCGRAQHRIGEEVTEELDWVPAKLIRRRIVRPKYACRCD